MGNTEKSGGEEMEKPKKAGDLMIPLEKYPHVPYWFTLRQVVAIMEKTKLDLGVPGGSTLARFVLVFNESYKLLGITRRRDILRGLEPHLLAAQPTPGNAGEKGSARGGEADSSGAAASYENLIKALCEQAERPVSEVMLPIQATVDYDDHIGKVIQKMVANNMSMVPVLKENTVVGVIRSVEVFHEIAQLIL
jgi:CBS domain-containing protein